MNKNELEWCGIKEYPVTWFTINDGALNFGVCEKTKKIAFFRIQDGTINNFAPLIIQDVLVNERSNGKCDDSQWCLCTDCEFCKSTPEKVLKKRVKPYWDTLTSEEKKELNSNNLNEFIKCIISNILETQKFINTYDYDHDGGIIYLKYEDE